MIATSLPPMPADAFAGGAGCGPGELQPPLQALKEEAQFQAAAPAALLPQAVLASPAVDAHLQDPGPSALRPAPPPLADVQFNGAPSPLLPPSVEQVTPRLHRQCLVKLPYKLHRREDTPAASHH